MTMPAAARKYVVDGIAGTPAVLARLVHGIGDDDSIWDARPDPERFSLREVLAHLADWDPIFVGRVERVRDEEHPILKSVDEGELCRERGYASQSGMANLARFTASRVRLCALLWSLPEVAWDRTCHRELVGDLTMDQLGAMILGHDAYHLRQVAEYLSAGV